MNVYCAFGYLIYDYNYIYTIPSPSLSSSAFLPLDLTVLEDRENSPRKGVPFYGMGMRVGF